MSAQGVKLSNQVKIDLLAEMFLFNWENYGGYTTQLDSVSFDRSPVQAPMRRAGSTRAAAGF